MVHCLFYRNLDFLFLNQMSPRVELMVCLGRQRIWLLPCSMCWSSTWAPPQGRSPICHLSVQLRNDSEKRQPHLRLTPERSAHTRQAVDLGCWQPRAGSLFRKAIHFINLSKDTGNKRRHTSTLISGCRVECQECCSVVLPYVYTCRSVVDMIPHGCQ